jgi:nucleotide-binding universal stress UspA family protein
MMQRILVGLDGSALAETILPAVARLAQRLAGEVVLLHVTDVPKDAHARSSGPAVDEVIASEQRQARAYLEEVAHRLQDATPCRVRMELAVGEAASQMVRHAERARADLIALATHGHSGLGRWFHGSVAEDVLHTTTTPLLLLRPVAEKPPAPFELQRLVVPLDGSRFAEAALPVAEELARALGLAIVLLRVVEPVGLAFAGDPLTAAYIDYQSLLEAPRGSAEHYLDEVARRLRERAAGVQVTREVLIGSPADAITARGRQQAGSLVVLATHGRTGWRAMLAGSVARRVALQARGPVVVVPPPEARVTAKSESTPS